MEKEEEEEEEEEEDLVLDLEALSLSEDLLADGRVDQPLLHLDELEEDVDSLLLRLVHVRVYDQAGDAAG